MHHRTYRSTLAVAAATPLTAVLLAAFFLPWVGLQDARWGLRRRVGVASGLDLTTGRVRLMQEAAGSDTAADLIRQRQQDIDDTVAARPWFALGAILPAGLLAVCIAALIGRISPAAAGRVLGMVAVGGLALSVAARNTDYAGDLVEDLDVRWNEIRRQWKQRKPPEDLPASRTVTRPTASTRPDAVRPMTRDEWQRRQEQRVQAGREQYEQRRRELSAAIRAEALSALWLSIGMYALVVLCGMVAATRRPPDYAVGRDASDDAGATSPPGD